MPTIGELCTRDVVVCTAETTVTAVAKLMRYHHVGSLVVVDRMIGGPGAPVGIVTDRDVVVGVTATELDPGTITAGDIMPSELLTVHADKTPLEAMQMMRLKGVRRLPVVSGDRKLVGLVSFDDLLELITDELSELTRVVSREQAREAAQRR